MKDAGIKKVYVYDKSQNKTSYMLPAQFRVIKQTKMLNLLNNLTNQELRSDKIFLYGYSYYSKSGIKVVIFIEQVFANFAQYRTFFEQMRKTHWRFGCLTVRGVENIICKRRR